VERKLFQATLGSAVDPSGGASVCSLYMGMRTPLLRSTSAKSDDLVVAVCRLTWAGEY